MRIRPLPIVVVTTVIGKTDALKTPTVVNPAIRYVCLSDVPRAVPPYECVLVEPSSAPRLLSRRLKILADHPALGHPEIVLWHDAAFRIGCDPVQLAETFLSDRVQMLAFAHPHRTQIEDEAAQIAKLGYMPADVLERQVATYRGEGFRQERITSTGFCLRRLTPEVVRFNALWWAEVERWGWRDQMSVDYALWKAGLEVVYIPGHYLDSPYAEWHKW